MDDGMRGWLLKTARKNYWRVASYHDLDDLIQDGYLHYARIKKRYPDVTDPKHLMRLFQVTYINHIHTLSVAKTREIAAVEALLGAMGGEQLELESGTFQALLSQAPQPIISVLNLFLTSNGRQRLREQSRRTRDHRETTNEKLCRLVGLDPQSVDLPAMIRNHFSGV